jgi:hypothetical protein
MFSKIIGVSVLFELRCISDIGLMAINGKYDPDQNFAKRDHIGSNEKRYIDIFLDAVRINKSLDKGKYPEMKKVNGMNVSVCGYGGILKYLNDVRPEVMSKLSAVADVIKNDSSPEDIKNAVKDLEWFQKMVKDRTEKDWQAYDAAISQLLTDL